ncbi:DUF6881 domain-containing protein [Streptomyces phytohabitans]|uniref:DUF6881 domain-containing protein n=1 Tax=Streptomyces phytohabitans TaxID=1150371 RepID=UPI00345C564B
MQYWQVLWHHDFPDEPVVLFSEIDDRGYETRKVERFRDGRLGWADETVAAGGTMLGEVPVGSIVDVDAQAEFTAVVIPEARFDAAWRRARG